MACKVDNMFVESLPLIFGQRGKVVKYLHDKAGSNNMVMQSIRTIATCCNVSQQTVHECLKTMEQAGLIKRMPGLVMLNPDAFTVGNTVVEAVKEQYKTFEEDYGNQSEEAE